jgi:hypothetical protein
VSGDGQMSEEQDKTPQFTRAFAFDIGLEFENPEEVCKRHKVSDVQYKALLKNKFFIETVDKFHSLVRKDGRYSQTIAGVLMDDIGLQAISSIIQRDNVEPDTVKSCVELLYKISGRDKSTPPEQVQSGYYVVAEYDKPTTPIGLQNKVEETNPFENFIGEDIKEDEEGSDILTRYEQDLD